MKQAPVCGLFGRRGVGKTTLAREVARHQARLLVWDYMGEYSPLAFRSEGNLEALRSYLVQVRGQRFAAARYVPRTGSVEEFEAFCRLAYGFGNVVLVVEEVAAVCSASYLPPEFGHGCAGAWSCSGAALSDLQRACFGTEWLEADGGTRSKGIERYPRSAASGGTRPCSQWSTRRLWMNCLRNMVELTYTEEGRRVFKSAHFAQFFAWTLLFARILRLLGHAA